MVNWSAIDVQNFSVANSDSHELLSILMARVSIKWIGLFLGFVLPVKDILGISFKGLNF